MVKQVQRWQAEDGTVHETKLKALEYDARQELKHMFRQAGGLELAEELIRNSRRVVELLEPVVKEQPIPIEERSCPESLDDD